ncbi:hypothetical protein LSUE1_G005157 [Lachnellula suecica]|uniref:Uncharacterized protein n=1 Tax=Lachnellula suecica TaxID=602035 RepID=A0A8T9CET7_9HELO|nr:hypothetical protein LSUE1_G005157 [Lachnellula suecica]
MAALLQYIYDTLCLYLVSLIQTLFPSYHALYKPETEHMDKEPEKPADDTPEPDQYQPKVKDVLEVKQFLIEKCKLPPELSDIVIDFAEYWPHTTNITSYNPIDLPHIRSGIGHENRFLLRSWPLGYIPSDSKFETTSIDKVVKQSTQLSPCPLPDNETSSKEAFENWTRSSMPRGEFACRKIIFTLKSHDQGWGGDYADKGTYRGSFTWFDFGLEKVSVSQKHPGEDVAVTEPPVIDTEKPADMSSAVDYEIRTILPRTVNGPNHTPEEPQYRFEHPLLPARNVLQKNRTAERYTQEHVVTWSWNDNILPESLDGNNLEQEGRGRDTATGEFVRNMKIGDVVTVWGKARFPGWVNIVDRVQIDVYWAV